MSEQQLRIDETQHEPKTTSDLATPNGALPENSMMVPAPRSPRRLTPAELARVGVKIVHRPVVKCLVCGEEWFAMRFTPDRGFHFYRYYWCCPNGCHNYENYRKRPRSCTPTALSVVGISVVQPPEFECQQCGERWYAFISTPQGYQLSHGYWHCPVGCNVTKKKHEQTTKVDAVSSYESDEYRVETGRQLVAFYTRHKFYNRLSYEERAALLQEMAAGDPDRLVPYDLTSYIQYAVLSKNEDGTFGCIAEVFTDTIHVGPGKMSEEIIDCYPEDLQELSKLLDVSSCHHVEATCVYGDPVNNGVNLMRHGCLHFQDHLLSLPVSPLFNRFEYIETEELFSDFVLHEYTNSSSIDDVQQNMDSQEGEDNE